MTKANKAPFLSFSRIKFRAVLRGVLIFVVYLLAFVALDVVSRTLEVYPGVVAWYPPDGLSFALLLTFGVSFLPWFVVASLISSILVFQLPQPFSILFVWAIFLSLTYGLAAWFLRQRIRIDTQMRNMRDLIWTIFVTSIVSTIVALVSVFTSSADGLIPRSDLFWATFQWWTGETIGVLVLVPALLIHVMPHVKRFAQGDKTSISFRLPSLKMILQALAVIASIYFAVEVHWSNDFHPYFLIGAPLIWIAIEHGLPGVSLGNVLANFGLTWTVQAHHHFELAELGQLQAMMLIITMTSLIVGAVISDHRQSKQALTPEIEQRRKMIAYEWISVAVLAMTAWLLEHSYNIFRSISDWEARTQIKGVDEILAMILVVGVASAVFSLRRWREYQVELRKREEAEAELQTLYSDLETKVQQRTYDLSKANERLKIEITERKRVEEEVEKSERRFRALVEHSMEEVSLVTADGTLVFESPSTRRPLGYPANSFVGHSLSELLHPADTVAASELLEQINKEPGGYREAIFRLKHMDGSWRWMEGAVNNLLDDPAVAAIVINYRDITERKLAEEETETRAHELLMLYELSRSLADTNDLDTILELVNHRTVESVHATFARIALLEGDELVMRSIYPIRFLDHDLLVDHRISITSMPYCQKVIGQDEPVLVRASDSRISEDERATLLLDFAQAIFLIPLWVHEFAAKSSRILGLLMIGETRKEEREPFTPEKIRLARNIGNQAAIAIDKVRLFNDLQRSNIDLSLAYDATIEGWSAALDLRDKETEGHTRRVTEMTLRLAKEMGFNEQELVQVRRGALLHDIGKMGVPDRILLKPDKLTDEEWIVMRMHPTYALQMLEPIAYLSSALDVPYCHHEKWDGTGYPRGLKGEEIPFAARIFAVVDVYDALTSDRPYRMGWPKEKTLEHIRGQSGTHFDPQVVEMFLKMI